MNWPCSLPKCRSSPGGMSCLKLGLNLSILSYYLSRNTAPPSIISIMPSFIPSAVWDLHII